MKLQHTFIIGLHEQTIRDGGLTVNIDSAVIINPAHFIGTDAYVVALPGGSVVPTFNVGRFVDAVRSQEARNGGHGFIGTWVSGPNIYVDTVEFIYDRDEAIRTARERGEQAIYNLGTSESEDI